MIRDLNRANYPSVDGTNGCNSDQELFEMQQLQDLLWSDPMVKFLDLNYVCVLIEDLTLVK